MNALWWIPIGWIIAMVIAVFACGIFDYDLEDPDSWVIVIVWPVSLLIFTLMGIYKLGGKLRG